MPGIFPITFKLNKNVERSSFSYFSSQSKYFSYNHGNNDKEQVESNNQSVLTSLD